MEILTIVILIIFLVGIIIAFWVGIKIGKFVRKREFEKQIPDIRGEAVEKSRQVLSGQFSEQLSPYLPDFPYNPCDCRFIGKPIDFVVFDGLSNGNLKGVTFLEVKSGDSKLNNNQKELKKVIDDKKVKFDEYRVPRELTKRD